MMGRMGGGLHFLGEIELEMAKMPAFTNLNMLIHSSTHSIVHPIWCDKASPIFQTLKILRL